jgi:hypothetical protein
MAIQQERERDADDSVYPFVGLSMSGSGSPFFYLGSFVLLLALLVRYIGSHSEGHVARSVDQVRRHDNSTTKREHEVRRAEEGPVLAFGRPVRP